VCYDIDKLLISVGQTGICDQKTQSKGAKAVSHKLSFMLCCYRPITLIIDYNKHWH
jgi:hypothetical protein